MCLTKTHRPNVIFLSETRKNKEYVELLRYQLGTNNVFTVSGHGKGGCLVVFWDGAYSCELDKYGEHFVDMYVNKGDGTKWRCTFIYGEAD